MRNIGILPVVLVIALIVTACMPVQPQGAEPAAVGLRHDAPEYGKHGPFWVGYKPLVIGSDTDQPLNASMWYPALNPNGNREEVTYAFTPGTPEWRSDTPAVAHGNALLNAPIDDARGPYPLVIFSHGFGANAVWTYTLVEHLASYGFIVLAPEHEEAWDPEFSNIAPASIDRPRDIKQTLDYAEQVNAPGGDMAGQIDMQNVAVMGHSYGGYAALAMGGAQYDLAAFNERCAQLPPDDPATFLCAPIVPNEADMAARAGLDPMPTGLWPSFGDPRVTAIVPMASDSYLFDKAGLAKITVPMLAIGGTADTGTPYDWGVRPAYDYASSAKKALVTMVGAEHTVVGAPCENIPWFKSFPAYEWACFDPVWNKDRALDLTHHFTTAFLLDTLKGDTAAHAALAPEAVSFPGIEYEAQGYTNQ
jgi:predicted dienelactone hydrolase